MYFAISHNPYEFKMFNSSSTIELVQLIMAIDFIPYNMGPIHSLVPHTLSVSPALIHSLYFVIFWYLDYFCSTFASGCIFHNISSNCMSAFLLTFLCISVIFCLAWVAAASLTSSLFSIQVFCWTSVSILPIWELYTSFTPSFLGVLRRPIMPLWLSASGTCTFDIAPFVALRTPVLWANHSLR